MRIKGEYVMREIAGETLLVPVGRTALKFNGMIILDPVGAVIWKEMEKQPDYDTLLACILEKFDVSADVAEQDLNEFLEQMEQADVLERNHA